MNICYEDPTFEDIFSEFSTDNVQTKNKTLQSQFEQENQFEQDINENLDSETENQKYKKTFLFQDIQFRDSPLSNNTENINNNKLIDYKVQLSPDQQDILISDNSISLESTESSINLQNIFTNTETFKYGFKEKIDTSKNDTTFKNSKYILKDDIINNEKDDILPKEQVKQKSPKRCILFDSDSDEDSYLKMFGGDAKRLNSGSYEMTSLINIPFKLDSNLSTEKNSFVSLDDNFNLSSESSIQLEAVHSEDLLDFKSKGAKNTDLKEMDNSYLNKSPIKKSTFSKNSELSKLVTSDITFTSNGDFVNDLDIMELNDIADFINHKGADFFQNDPFRSEVLEDQSLVSITNRGIFKEDVSNLIQYDKTKSVESCNKHPQKNSQITNNLESLRNQSNLSETLLDFTKQFKEESNSEDEKKNDYNSSSSDESYDSFENQPQNIIYSDKEEYDCLDLESFTDDSLDELYFKPIKVYKNIKNVKDFIKIKNDGVGIKQCRILSKEKSGKFCSDTCMNCNLEIKIYNDEIVLN